MEHKTVRSIMLAADPEWVDSMGVLHETCKGIDPPSAFSKKLVL